MVEEKEKMEENKKQIKEEKKDEKKIEETIEKEKRGEKDEKKAEKTGGEKVAEGEKEKGKKEEGKKKEEIKKKEKAIARGKDLRISTKQSVAICNFIRRKDIEKAVEDLEKVVEKEKAVPMKLEVPHRKGMERGRYPVKACKIFIELLKSLAANSQVSGLENPYIAIAKADMASRPYKRFGSQRFKRTHVYLEARERKGKEEVNENKEAK